MSPARKGTDLFDIDYTETGLWLLDTLKSTHNAPDTKSPGLSQRHDLHDLRYAGVFRDFR